MWDGPGPAVPSPPVDRTTFRLVMIGLALLLGAVAALGFALNPSGERVELPPPLISVEPAPEEAVLPQIGLVVELDNRYRIELTVDGRPVPDGELRFDDASGVYAWEPGPGRTLEAWAPGEHRVAITWDRIVGLPDPGTFAWTFRVQ